jgi:hypothetical protein
MEVHMAGGRKKHITPEAAGRLAELAREMRELVYGAEAFPVWGTRFSEIEEEGMVLGLELARLFIEQSVAQQAQCVPDEALEAGGEVAQCTGSQEISLETPAGAVGWEQPRTRLSTARRDFFPSGEGLGGGRR